MMKAIIMRVKKVMGMGISFYYSWAFTITGESVQKILLQSTSIKLSRFDLQSTHLIPSHPTHISQLQWQ